MHDIRYRLLREWVKQIVCAAERAHHEGHIGLALLCMALLDVDRHATASTWADHGGRTRLSGRWTVGEPMCCCWIACSGAKVLVAWAELCNPASCARRRRVW